MKLLIRIIWWSTVFVILFISSPLKNNKSASTFPASQQSNHGSFPDVFARIFSRKSILLSEPSRSISLPFFVNLRDGVKADKLVLGSNFILEEGEKISGDLLNIGGNVILETGSLVEGDVVVFGGSIQIKGQINGDVFTLGGDTDIGASAIIEGELASIGGNLDVEENARIKGDVLEGVTDPFQIPIPLTMPSFIKVPAQFSNRIGFTVNPVVGFGWLFIRSLVWSVGALFFALFLSRPMETVGRTAISQPVISGGLGLLTVMVAPFAMVLFALTLIGIPVSIFLFLLLGFIWFFGMISIGLETGKRLEKMLKSNWSLVISAGIGTFLFTLVLNLVRSLLPCIGVIVPILIGIIGIGSVLVTRMGFREYPLLASNSSVISSESQLTETEN